MSPHPFSAREGRPWGWGMGRNPGTDPQKINPKTLAFLAIFAQTVSNPGLRNTKKIFLQCFVPKFLQGLGKVRPTPFPGGLIKGGCTLEKRGVSKPESSSRPSPAFA